MGWIIAGVLILILVGVAIYDLVQTNDPILRNYPVVGHGRQILTILGPKMRQYIVANNNEERPFNRDQRHWVYASSEKHNNYFGFGTDNDLELTPSYLIIKQSAFPLSDPHPGDPTYDSKFRIPSAKTMGAARERSKAFRPNSIINVSAMSYGSLSAAAVHAINCGAEICGCLQNSGEGGLSPHHDHGGELIWQLGTGLFGTRMSDGRFDESKFVETCEKFPVRAIEIKLSQGAKPGRGGVLPASKITQEISKIRGIPMGQDCISPSSHREFSNVDEMLDFVERIAELTGLPVGIKSAVGEMEFWRDLVDQMTTTNRGVDFITIDGGEGGTGAAPLTFSDHVAMPFKLGFSRVFRAFAEASLAEKIVFIGSGKLGFPEQSLLAMAMGCDMINIGRTAMLAVGCIQAQECHTGSCPTGVATQNKWLMHGLNPANKAAKLANYVTTLRKEILQLCRACAVHHPAFITPDHFEILHDSFETSSVKERFKLQGLSTSPSPADCIRTVEIMREMANKI